MDAKEKLKLLKSLQLLDQIPEDKLSTLSDFLEPCTFADGGVVFEEGSTGDSLYFISAGHIRISKKVVQDSGAAAFKDIAIIGPSDCFGEMALIEESAPRSARAAAAGEAVLFKLGRKELNRWLESNPALALGFFAELVQVLSKRLRRSSNELALLFDLSQWLLEPIAGGKELLTKVLRHTVPHFEGTWTGGAYLYNQFNEEMEIVAVEGAFKTEAGDKPPSFRDKKLVWLDGNTVAVSLPGLKRVEGYLVLRTPVDIGGEAKNEIGRTLTTAASLIASALENLQFRTEDTLRARLKTSTESYGPGL